MNKEDIIICENLNKFYSGVHALKDLSLKIKKDSVVGLIGDNGAGKSTLIKILSGAHPADSGTIYFEGNEVKFKSTKEAMNLGIETIYQYSALIPEMSIARNIFIGREHTKYNIGSFGLLKKQEMETDAMKALTDVELHLRSPETPVNQLSGGERQGVVIARAMYFKSKVLILDEPTNHLSVKETNKVLRFVEGLKKQGVTSVFITHNLSHIFPIADHLCVMARGQKIADMPKKDTNIDELTDFYTCEKLIEKGLCNNFPAAILDEGYRTFTVGGYYSPDEKLTFSITSSFIDPTISGARVDTIQDFQFAVDREWGDGTLHASYKTFPFYKVPDLNGDRVQQDDLGSFVEVYYTYNVNDSLTLRPGVAITMPTQDADDIAAGNDDLAFSLIERTAIGVGATFNF